jgi:hypothetical protein
VLLHALGIGRGRERVSRRHHRGPGRAERVPQPLEIVPVTGAYQAHHGLHRRECRLVECVAAVHRFHEGPKDPEHQFFVSR